MQFGPSQALFLFETKGLFFVPLAAKGSNSGSESLQEMAPLVGAALANRMTVALRGSRKNAKRLETVLFFSPVFVFRQVFGARMRHH